MLMLLDTLFNPDPKLRELQGPNITFTPQKTGSLQWRKKGDKAKREGERRRERAVLPQCHVPTCPCKGFVAMNQASAFKLSVALVGR